MNALGSKRLFAIVAVAFVLYVAVGVASPLDHQRRRTVRVHTKGCDASSGKQIIEYAALRYDSMRATEAIIQQAAIVNSELMIDRGDDLSRRRWTIRGVSALLVAGSIDKARPDTAAG